MSELTPGSISSDAEAPAVKLIDTVDLEKEASTGRLRELDLRIVGSKTISLTWLRGPNSKTTFVNVTHPTPSESFVLRVQPPENPLDVFYAPSSYAARLRREAGESESAQAA